jgi:hypothetical protein
MNVISSVSNRTLSTQFQASNLFILEIQIEDEGAKWISEGKANTINFFLKDIDVDLNTSCI